MPEACLVCGGRELSRLFHVDRFPLVIGAVPADRPVPEHPLTIASCRACSLIQQVGRLDKATVDTLYSADYYSCPSPVLTGMGAGEIDKFHRFLRGLGLSPGRLLEIACFDGYLLLKLQADGWEAHGCDPASQARIAAERLGAQRVRREFFG